MLEYESIPGVVSTLRRFKSEQKKSEDIITVKDITNKVLFISFSFFLTEGYNDERSLLDSRRDNF